MKLTTIFLLLLLPLLGIAQQKIKFKKIDIDSAYVSEGVTVGDIDKDGLDDIVAGDVWYKAPNWERYEIRPLGNYYGMMPVPTRPVGSGASYYARCIANYVIDIDKDGWLDVVTFNTQGGSCYWYRNPQKNYQQSWEEYLAIELFHNESPQMLDLFGDGKIEVLAGNHIGDNKYTLSWFSIPEDPTKLWEPHIIGYPDNFKYSATYRITEYFAPGGRGHGLGLGDINGDGIKDIITAQGWYETPANAKGYENWTFHHVPLDSMADTSKIHLLFAQMFADDFDGDGDNDIIAGSAHGYGLWWFEQVKKGGKIDFVKHEIAMNMSQLHAMNKVDLDGDGKMEYVFGKRYLAHLGRDPGEFDPAVIGYVGRGKDNKLTAYVIDNNSASGTQIWITDLNKDGKPDVLSSNKKGTHIFLQE
ncbi:MAG: hypothetical protein GC192_14875 [Bacteroidetes bacterium]|nr:hypothetical protein [Bacteroidota bacterium]